MTDAPNIIAELEWAIGLVESECWTLKCCEYPTGFGDASVGWEVVAYFQEKPNERVIGYGSTPLDAVKDAARKEPRP